MPSAATSSSRKGKKPSKPELDDQAKEILTEADAMKLGGAIKVVEGIKKCSLLVLLALGVGSKAGVVLSEVTDPTALGLARLEYAKELQGADERLEKLAGSGAEMKKESLGVILRWLVNIAILATQARSGGSSTSSSSTPGTSYVTVQSEEDRGFSLNTYSAEDIKDAKGSLIKISNLRLKSHLLASMAVFKRVAYWIKMDGSVPSPDRVKLSSFRVADTDSYFMLLRRLLYTIAVVSAAMTVQTGTRDDGAGLKKRWGVLWCNPDVVIDLIDEIDEVRDTITDAQMGVIANLIYLSL